MYILGTTGRCHVLAVTSPPIYSQLFAELCLAHLSGMWLSFYNISVFNLSYVTSLAKVLSSSSEWMSGPGTTNTISYNLWLLQDEECVLPKN